jgi:hypothetical protein
MKQKSALIATCFLLMNNVGNSFAVSSSDNKLDKIKTLFEFRLDCGVINRFETSFLTNSGKENEFVQSFKTYKDSEQKRLFQLHFAEEVDIRNSEGRLLAVRLIGISDANVFFKHFFDLTGHSIPNSNGVFDYTAQKDRANNNYRLILSKDRHKNETSIDIKNSQISIISSGFELEMRKYENLFVGYLSDLRPLTTTAHYSFQCEYDAASFENFKDYLFENTHIH